MQFQIPKPCVPPIRDLWWKAGAPSLTRCFSNVVIQRLAPSLTEKASREFETLAFGHRNICFIYPTNVEEGHYFELAEGVPKKIARTAARQLELPPHERAAVILLAVWRPRHAGADPRLHLWAIPHEVVAAMDHRLPSKTLGTRIGRTGRNVMISPPDDGRPSVWKRCLEGVPDPDPIAIQPYYMCWQLSAEELKYVQEGERNELIGDRGEEEI